MDDTPVPIACRGGERRREVTEDAEDRTRRYEAEVITADLTGHRHTMRGARASEIEARMRRIHPAAATLLVRPEDGEEPEPDTLAAETDYLLMASFRNGVPR